MELAVIEWAAKWKLFNPFFFSLIRGEVLFILYLCSLCRFIKERCFPLYIVIPLMCFDFSRCIWNCQPLGFLLLYLDKVGLREVSFFFFFFFKSYEVVLALPLVWKYQKFFLQMFCNSSFLHLSAWIADFSVRQAEAFSAQGEHWISQLSLESSRKLREFCSLAVDICMSFYIQFT